MSDERTAAQQETTEPATALTGSDHGGSAAPAVSAAPAPRAPGGCMSEIPPDSDFPYHCHEHGWWSAKKESGCPTCVSVARKRIRQLERELSAAREQALHSNLLQRTSVYLDTDAAAAEYLGLSNVAEARRALKAEIDAAIRAQALDAENKALENAAKVCEESGKQPSSFWHEVGCWEHASDACADAIRALKKEPK